MMKMILIIISLCTLLNYVYCTTDSNNQITKSSPKESLAKLFNWLHFDKELQDPKDECLALAIKENSLEELIMLRLAVQEKLSLINNPQTDDAPLSFDEYTAHATQHTSIHSPLYKYEMLLKNILTQQEFEDTKKHVYTSAQGSISQSIVLYKKIIKQHKTFLKKIDKCLEEKIRFVKENQFRMH